MTQDNTRTQRQSSDPVDGRASRLRVKPDSAKTGYVDGAWWPRSDNLRGELPALLATVTSPDRPSPPDHLPPRRVGERPSDLGTRDRRLVILAIPPYTDDHQAFAAITAASATGDVSTVDELPMISPGERRMRSVTIPGPCDDQCLSSEARHARGFQYLITERMPMPRFIYRRADD